MRGLLILLLVFSSISIPIAYAHPFTEETIPSLVSNAPTGTSEVIIFFSEPIDINFSEVKVLDNNGNQIDNKDTNYFEDELSLIVTTPPLEDGVYTVTTRSEEHTSELQSQAYLVCRLLLEKKNPTIAVRTCPEPIQRALCET